MNKVVRDGYVAVLYSPGYGGGWSTEDLPPETAFHPKLVELVEENRRDEITGELCEALFGHNCRYGDSESLEICWVPQGMDFYIENYDGFEKVVSSGDDNWHTA